MKLFKKIWKCLFGTHTKPVGIDGSARYPANSLAEAQEIMTNIYHEVDKNGEIITTYSITS